MKIIISHDIDHLYWREHWLHDLFILKLWVKNILFLSRRQLPPRLAWQRILVPLIARKNNNAAELSAFDREHDIPSTFFVATGRGLGLSYTRKNAAKIINILKNNGHEIGLHGIAYNNAMAMERELQAFKDILPDTKHVGIRNHYLRTSQETQRLMKTLGYAFDSTENRIASPYNIDGLREFPVCLMDSIILKQSTNDQAMVRKQTLQALNEAENAGITHFTIDTHDVYFSDLYPDHKAWYEWLVTEVLPKYELTTFLNH